MYRWITASFDSVLYVKRRCNRNAAWFQASLPRSRWLPGASWWNRRQHRVRWIAAPLSNNSWKEGVGYIDLRRRSGKFWTLPTRRTKDTIPILYFYDAVWFRTAKTVYRTDTLFSGGRGPPWTHREQDGRGIRQQQIKWSLDQGTCAHIVCYWLGCLPNPYAALRWYDQKNQGWITFMENGTYGQRLWRSQRTRTQENWMRSWWLQVSSWMRFSGWSMALVKGDWLHGATLEGTATAPCQLWLATGHNHVIGFINKYLFAGDAFFLFWKHKKSHATFTNNNMP